MDYIVQKGGLYWAEGAGWVGERAGATRYNVKEALVRYQRLGPDDQLHAEVVRDDVAFETSRLRKGDLIAVRRGRAKARVIVVAADGRVYAELYYRTTQHWSQ